MIHGRGGIVFFALVEGHEEEVAMLFLDLVDALPQTGWHKHIECGAYLIARIVGVNAERAGKEEGVVKAASPDVFEAICNQLLYFPEEHGISGKGRQFFPYDGHGCFVFERGVPEGEVEHLKVQIFKGW